MTALLIGLLMVAIGAAGTWLALFGNNPARRSEGPDSPLSPVTAEAELSPRLAGAAPPGGGRTEATARQWPSRNPGRAVPSYGQRLDRFAPSSDVHTPAARRIRSIVVLLAMALALAAMIGAAVSAMVVLVFMFVS